VLKTALASVEIRASKLSKFTPEAAMAALLKICRLVIWPFQAKIKPRKAAYSALRNNQEASANASKMASILKIKLKGTKGRRRHLNCIVPIGERLQAALYRMANLSPTAQR